MILMSETRVKKPLESIETRQWQALLADDVLLIQMKTDLVMDPNESYEQRLVYASEIITLANEIKKLLEDIPRE